jgi:RNA polymerase sigma-70 factor (ECF subfamily)
MQDAFVSESQRDAVERAYRQDADRLWRAVLMYAGDAEVASDAVAEAFAQALRRGGELRAPERWVWRAAFRIARGELARRRALAPLKDEPVEISDASPVLELALSRLSPRQRGAVVLHYYGGYPLAEVASILGSTTGAVAVHLHRARRRLYDLLTEEE